MIDRRKLLAGSGVMATGWMMSGLSAPAQAQVRAQAPAAWPEPVASLDLWPTGIGPGLRNPNLKAFIKNDSQDPAIRNRWTSGVTRPRIDIFSSASPNGAAMLVIPGGGYGRVYFDHEGYDIARFLNGHGITAFVLTYRLPAEGWDKAADVPLADAQRAMRLIRARSADYGIDPRRLGVMGFSAGGHLCASLATRYKASVYTSVDAVDTQDARPVIAAPIYPVISTDPAIAHMGSRNNLLGTSPTPEQLVTYAPDRMVTRETPPTFLAHAEDDGAVPAANSLVLRAALIAAGVPVETHLFPTGGHGFGLRLGPARAWADLFIGFAQRQGLMSR